MTGSRWSSAGCWSGARTRRTGGGSLFVIPGHAKREPGISRFRVRLCEPPGMTRVLKPSRAHFNIFVRKEDLLGVLDDILRFPALVRRLPAFFFHHPHL